MGFFSVLHKILKRALSLGFGASVYSSSIENDKGTLTLVQVTYKVSFESQNILMYVRM